MAFSFFITDLGLMIKKVFLIHQNKGAIMLGLESIFFVENIVKYSLLSPPKADLSFLRPIT